MSPSVLTVDKIKLVAQLYAFYCDHIRDGVIKTNEQMLRMLADSANVDVWSWAQANREKVKRAESELIEIVETSGNPGFRTYG